MKFIVNVQLIISIALFLVFYDSEIYVGCKTNNENKENNRTMINKNDKYNYGLDKNKRNIYYDSCNKFSCPSTNGECIENICLCAMGYTTLETKSNKKQIIKPKCNYSYKYRIYATLCEAIFPFGIGHIYTNRYIHASYKFIFFWFLSFSRVLFKKQVKNYPTVEKANEILIWVFASIYVLDIVCFYIGYYVDGSGINLL